MTVYDQVVREFAITLRRDGEKFSQQFQRVVKDVTKGSMEHENAVWLEVMARAVPRGVSALAWIDSYQDKAVLVENLRKGR